MKELGECSRWSLPRFSSEGPQPQRARWRKLMELTRFKRPRFLLTVLLAAAFLPASALVYLQYRALSQVQEQMHTALFANLRQALIGARVEAENDFYRWHRRALIGLEIHEWLRQSDIERMRGVAEVTRRLCPQMSFFFAYRDIPGSPVEVFIFRPGEMRRMDYSEADAAHPEIRKLISQIVETTSHWYVALQEIGGERHLVFLHLVDDDPVETRQPHAGKAGYYGFTVSERTLGEVYFPRLLDKHLRRLTFGANRNPVGPPITAIFNESGRQLSTSPPDADALLMVQESLNESLPGWTIRAGFPSGGLTSFDKAQLVRSVGAAVLISGLLVVAITFLGMTAAREMELSRAKTDFVASVSHEFKTPLSLIRGFVETVHLNRVRNPAQREDYFRIIESEIFRLSGMIDRILEISKIEVGLKRYEPETVDVGGLIEDTLASFAHELERKSFALECHIETPLPPANVDPQAFSQALLNLLSNAVKYSGEERRITVNAVRHGNRLEVSVADRGVGISKLDVRRVFDRFYRADHVRAETTGAGLGLALVRHFARAHGGDATVTSTPGQGSTFAIHLPLST